MTMEKTHVPLSSIVPSDNNPRKDFGDIDALAAAIRATNSQCVNPPIVVRDGNAYRIVDGERRYRALRKIWHALPDRAVEVLVCQGYDEADEAVAMLATDDKKPLTEAERAAGTQRMLLLGVEDARVASAPSGYEVARWVAGKTSGAGYLVSYNGRPAVWACRSFAALYDLCAEDGWWPDAKAEELRQYCADAEEAAE
jgi:hypothetical protein